MTKDRDDCTPFTALRFGKARAWSSRVRRAGGDLCIPVGELGFDCDYETRLPVVAPREKHPPRLYKEIDWSTSSASRASRLIRLHELAPGVSTSPLYGAGLVGAQLRASSKPAKLGWSGRDAVAGKGAEIYERNPGGGRGEGGRRGPS